MDRKAILLGTANSGTPILEIGPSYNPAAPRQEGWNTAIIDHAPASELRAKYAAMGVDTSRIEDVDFISTGGPLHACVPAERHGSFGRLIASHVIEHVPDVLGFLQSAAILLAPDGVLALAVPDKRFCFDYFKPPSTTGDIIAAHGSIRHPRRTLFQQNAYSASADSLHAWGSQPIASTALMGGLETAWMAAGQASQDPDSPYIDAHAWHFTPAWFRLAMLELAEGGMIDWHVDEMTPTVFCEFIVTLRRGRPAWPDHAAREAERLSLLNATLSENHEQSGFAVAGGLIAGGAAPSAGAVGQPPWALAEASGAADGVAALHPLARWLNNVLTRGAPLRCTRLAGPLPGPEEIGHLFPPYQPIMPRAELFVDGEHAAIAAMPLEGGLVGGEVKGFLRPADALALYELAWYAPGDVLEMGSAWGLSTTILGRAMSARVQPGKLLTIEIAPGFQAATEAAMRKAGLGHLHVMLPGDATVIAKRMADSGRRIGAAFIDHDHSHAATRAACRDVACMLVPGGLALVHDFNDRNNIIDPGIYGVYAGVCDSVAAGELEFIGVVGCCALLRKPVR